ncbi:MAG: hypothetical protein WBJ37_10935 [Bacteroidales bacterium]
MYKVERSKTLSTSIWAGLTLSAKGEKKKEKIRKTRAIVPGGTKTEGLAGFV